MVKESNNEHHSTNETAYNGKIIVIRGSVVDVHFDWQIPGLQSSLNVDTDSPTIIEVVSHLDDHTIKGYFNPNYILKFEMSSN